MIIIIKNTHWINEEKIAIGNGNGDGNGIKGGCWSGAGKHKWIQMGKIYRAEDGLIITFECK